MDPESDNTNHKNSPQNINKLFDSVYEAVISKDYLLEKFMNSCVESPHDHIRWFTCSKCLKIIAYDKGCDIYSKCINCSKSYCRKHLSSDHIVIDKMKWMCRKCVVELDMKSNICDVCQFTRSSSNLSSLSSNDDLYSSDGIMVRRCSLCNTNICSKCSRDKLRCSVCLKYCPNCSGYNCYSCSKILCRTHSSKCNGSIEPCPNYMCDTCTRICAKCGDVVCPVDCTSASRGEEYTCRKCIKNKGIRKIKSFRRSSSEKINRYIKK